MQAATGRPEPRTAPPRGAASNVLQRAWGPTTRRVPLSHLTVLDLSRVLAGPWCTQLLADLGATVIKIERPGSGDDTRAWGPPFLKDAQGSDTSEAAYYLACNRGKLSVAVDFTKPEGQRIVRDLALQADVLVENFKVGGLAKYGLDYASVAALNPRLVYASITGFGQDGPYADRAGYDFIIQGMSGFMSVTGERDDLPGGGPQKAGVAITDLMTGMYAAVAILAALQHRDRTGQGQRIDLALLDSAVAMMAVMGMNHLVSGTPPGRAGNAHQNIVPYQVFACADGHLILAVGNDSQFAKFCAVAGHPEWARDERFARNVDRVRNRDALVPLVAGAIATRTQREWLGRAGGGRRAVRPDQQARCGVRRSAVAGARHETRPAASARRQRAAGERAGQDVGDAARARAAAAAAGPAHAAGAARTPRAGRRHRRAPRRRGSHRDAARHDRPHVSTHAQARVLDRLRLPRRDVPGARVAAVPAGDSAGQPGHQARAA